MATSDSTTSECCSSSLDSDEYWALLRDPMMTVEFDWEFSCDIFSSNFDTVGDRAWQTIAMELACVHRAAEWNVPRWRETRRRATVSRSWPTLGDCVPNVSTVNVLVLIEDDVFWLNDPLNSTPTYHISDREDAFFHRSMRNLLGSVHSVRRASMEAAGCCCYRHRPSSVRPVRPLVWSVDCSYWCWSGWVEDFDRNGCSCWSSVNCRSRTPSTRCCSLCRHSPKGSNFLLDWDDEPMLNDEINAKNFFRHREDTLLRVDVPRSKRRDSRV